MQELMIDGIRFKVSVDGPQDAPALMLSNSLSSNLAMWEPQMPELTKRWRVVRYDHRGHGGTEAPPGPYSYARLAQDAVDILDALGIKRAHWCGLSMGGMTGMWLLTRHADRVERAVLANTSAYMGAADLWDGRIRTAREQGMAALADATLERWFTAGFREREPQTVAKVRQMILTTPVEGYVGCCGAIRDMDQRETIKAIDKPVLVIIGAHDPSTTPEAGELIASSIPNARSVTLDAAHLSNLEQPEAFTKAVVEFLEGGR
jgi:3-oxoadipate enol-lactonase